ncbi:hypothetical protein FNV43_RR24364 [Rhamnella rubrinervis]|uniref:WRKY domain-containing protein n=1 Tax=Rhamnella rubrinervis TaxID=2594499 RepID=A0A8K0DLC8_9ROSA|nr:hypothetical protein FNV43_RR24364 [Rhamnella rubrinervis]
MDDSTITLILEGCNQARELESNLASLVKQPQLLYNSCDEIVKVFDSAKKRLQSAYDMPHELHPQHIQIDPAILQELLQSIDAARGNLPESSRMINVELQQGSGGGLHLPAMDVTLHSAGGASGASSSSQRPRKRKENMEVRVERMAAPKIGNTEIPPEDGFTWRKYGQKEIMGSRFPRGYFRCTHQKLYQCPAKKQVQRLDDDPYTYEVKYRGDHTCHMSATAPSILPLPDITRAMTTTTSEPPPLTSTTSTTTSVSSLGRLLSMDVSLSGGGTSSGGMIEVSGSGSAGGAGTSTGTRNYGKEVEYPVVDMADVMFNTGVSNTINSMDFLFPSMEDKWDSSSRDKKDTGK